VAVITGLGVCLTPQTALAAPANAWTASLGDAGNTANNPGETVLTAANAARAEAAWTSTMRPADRSAPVVLAGIAYHIVIPPQRGGAYVLVASSARTGSTLWSLQLPEVGHRIYWHELSVSGRLLLAPYTGQGRPGGVSAVDLQTRRVVWSSSLPPSTISWSPNYQPGRRAYTDGARVYLTGSSNAINTYRLSDGALLWTHPFASDGTNGIWGVDGVAVANGVLFTGGGEGLVAYDAATGRRLWGAYAAGIPVVAGGRVFAIWDGTAVAFAAAGCGRARCSPLWTYEALLGQNPRLLSVAGADASSLFLTYGTEVPPPPRGTTGSFVGHVVRLSAATGRLQWSVSVGRAAVGLVRGGGMIWLYNEYLNADGVTAVRILGYSATATGSNPIREIPLRSNLWGFPQALAVAGGTLIQRAGPGMIGYRVPGT
jgi:outer membrane protein assembly factor BamB